MCDFKADLRFIFSEYKYQEIEGKDSNFFVDKAERNRDLESGVSDSRVLVSYKKCDNECDSFTKFNRGAIYDSNTRELLVPSFGYTRDIVCSNEKSTSELIEKLVGGDNLFLESHEGTLLRLYYNCGEWRVSTHRKLDAFKSKWSSKSSFGQMFVNGLRNYGFDGETQENVFKNFTDTLNIFNTYFVFVLSNKDTSVVCDNKDNQQRLFHVGTIFNDQSNPVFRFDVNIGIPYPKILNFNKDEEELMHYVNNIDYTKSQGVFVISKDMNTWKILNEEYTKIHKEKSNKYNLTYGYLRNRNNEEYKLRFMKEREQDRQFFDNLEKSISSLGRYLFDVYINRYVKKTIIKIKQRHHFFIVKCHEWHKSDRKNNIVRIDVIFNRLNNLPPHILMGLLNDK